MGDTDTEAVLLEDKLAADLAHDRQFS